MTEEGVLTERIQSLYRDHFDNIIQVDRNRMVIMVVTYTLTVAAVDVFVMFTISDYRDEIMLFWNLSNLLYICLNLILVFIVNFDTYPCVSRCFLKWCYIEEGEKEEEATTGSEKVKGSQKDQACCVFLGRAKDCFIGMIFPFVAFFLIAIITVSLFLFCFRTKKANQPSLRQIKWQSESSKAQNVHSIEPSEIIIREPRSREI